MEFGYLELIPLTAGTMFNVGAVDKLYVHDCFHNADGIAASTSTIFWVLATATQYAAFDRNLVWVDAAQGPWIRAAGIIKGLSVRDFELYIEAGTWAVAIDLAGVGAANFNVGPGIITGGGTALTSLGTQADKTVNTTHGFIHDVHASTVGPAATALWVATTAAEADIARCRRGVATDTAAAATTTGDVAYTG
jgi:hypothetical protein